MKKHLLIITFILPILLSFAQNDSIHGTIIKIEGERVFIDLSSKDVDVGTILNVLVERRY